MEHGEVAVRPVPQRAARQRLLLERLDVGGRRSCHALGGRGPCAQCAAQRRPAHRRRREAGGRRQEGGRRLEAGEARPRPSLTSISPRSRCGRMARSKCSWLGLGLGSGSKKHVLQEARKKAEDARENKELPVGVQIQELRRTLGGLDHLRSSHRGAAGRQLHRQHVGRVEHRVHQSGHGSEAAQARPH